MRPSNTILHHHSCIISPCWMIYVWQDASVGSPHVIAPAGVLQPPVTWFRYKVTLKLQSDILHSVKDCTLLLLLGEEFTINLFSVTTARRQQEVWDSELPVWHNIHCGVLPRADLQPRGWWVAVVVTWDMGHIIRPSLLQSTGSVTNQSQDTTMEPRNTGCPDF